MSYQSSSTNQQMSMNPPPPVLKRFRRKADFDTILSPSKPAVANKWIFNKQHKTEHTPVFRIVDRGGDFYQSSGKVSIRKKIQRGDWRALYSGDWFHSLVNAPFYRIVLLLTFCYLLMTASFACLYYLISVNYGCHLGIEHFVEAFAFSLQTMATIGYDTKDIFFGDCWIAVATVTFQVLMGILSDALIIGVIYCRLARPHARASTIVFSNKGVIRRIKGRLYFMFQLCELRKQQLVESHVRLYVVKNEVDPLLSFTRTAPEAQDELMVVSGDGATAASVSRNLFQSVTESSLLLAKADASSSPATMSSESSPGVHRHFIQTCSMRLTHPSDELGGMLLLMLPQVVVHEINAQSPLMPPSRWFTNSDDQEVCWQCNYGADMSPCTNPDCGSSSSIQSGMRDSHHHHQQYVNDNVLNNGSNWYDEEKAMVARFLRDRQVEIIAVVEGTDATTGGNVQARHSFLMSDIEWDKSFEPCLYKDVDDYCTTVDFSLFHELVPAPLDAEHAGPLSSLL